MLRQTRQRTALRQALVEAGRPLSVEEMLESARRRVPGLGLRTVYRQVREMQEARELIGLDYPGQPVRYELPSPRGGHPHFICRACARVYDLPDDTPPVPYAAPPGFVIDGEEVVFYGYCPSCQPPAKPGTTAASGALPPASA